MDEMTGRAEGGEKEIEKYKAETVPLLRTQLSVQDKQQKASSEKIEKLTEEAAWAKKLLREQEKMLRDLTKREVLLRTSLESYQTSFSPPPLAGADKSKDDAAAGKNDKSKDSSGEAIKKKVWPSSKEESGSTATTTTAAKLTKKKSSASAGSGGGSFKSKKGPQATTAVPPPEQATPGEGETAATATATATLSQVDVNLDGGVGAARGAGNTAP
eukprot:CAMPEP_0171831104 /NCGR_PEP_ID=MMETSP0992-20121227/8596_1 /TAXON_ID=483369 /ORGANISM="non described non described, Strain CCMP2098" /LENGTH=214 /DNA_ID=CAMNT_0012446487 /DNA_START=9 /DNA_END=649 /DNA_ORIENTATION=+